MTQTLDNYKGWQRHVECNYDSGVHYRAVAHKSGYAALWEVVQTEREAIDRLNKLIDRTERSGS